MRIVLPLGCQEGSQLVSDTQTIPVERIPNEVLACLFEHIARILLPHPPVVLVQVCRRWRTLATKLLSLWNSIYITARSPPALIRFWLRRSGDRYLDLILNLGNVYRGEAVEITKVFMEILLPHSPRWRRFIFLSHHLSVNDKLKSYLKSIHLPRLEHLDLTFDGAMYHRWAHPVNVCKRGTPQLTSLRISCFGFSPSLIRNLTRLELRRLEGFTPLAFAGVLNATVALEHLRLADIHILESPAEDAVIHLTSLLSLTIIGANALAAQGFCTVIHAPNLTSLSLRAVSLSNLGSLLRCQSRPRYPILRSLSLSSVHIFDQEDTDYIQYVPKLTHMHIDACSLLPDIQKQTSCPMTWPRLHSITVTNTSSLLRHLLPFRIAAMAEQGYPVREVFVQKCDFERHTFAERLWQITKVCIAQFDHETEVEWVGDVYCQPSRWEMP